MSMAALEERGVRYRVVGKKGALLRCEASLQSAEAGELALGDIVTVLQRETVGVRERWRVTDGTKSGWATSKMFEACVSEGVAPVVKQKIEVKKKKRRNKGKALDLVRAFVDARIRKEDKKEFDESALASAWRVVGVPDLAMELHRKCGDAEVVAELEEVIRGIDGRRGTFFPREAPIGETALDERKHGIIVKDGRLKKANGIQLGYRAWRFLPDLREAADVEVRKIRVPYPVPPLLLYFHGNGEVAPEYDSWAQASLSVHHP